MPDSKSCECCSPSRGTSSTDIQASVSGDSSKVGMSLIPAQKFLMGSDSHHVFHSDHEGPVRPIALDAFWIDETSVTNAAFAKFVTATSYKTEAEVLAGVLFLMVWSAQIPLPITCEADSNAQTGG